jgi:hypothetical protein
MYCFFFTKTFKNGFVRGVGVLPILLINMTSIMMLVSGILAVPSLLPGAILTVSGLRITNTTRASDKLIMI